MNGSTRSTGRSAARSAGPWIDCSSHDLEQPPLDDPPAAATPRAVRGMAADLLELDQHELDLEVRVGQERSDGDELGERVGRPRVARRAPPVEEHAVVVDLGDPRVDGDGMDHAHAMPGARAARPSLTRIPDIPRVWISMSRPSRTRSMT